MALLAVILSGAPTATHAAPPGVRLLAADPGRIRFVVEVPPAVLASALPGVDETGLVRLSIDGYEDLAAPGEPALPARVVNVAVPPRGSVRVQAWASDLRVHEPVKLAALPIHERGAERPQFAPARAGADAGPAGARLLDVSWMRHQRIARILITPAELDGVLGRLRVSRRVEVEVEVEPTENVGPPVETQDPFERAYHEVLVNYEQGRAWRRTAIRSLGFEGGGVSSALLGVAAPPDTSSVFAGRSWIKIAITQAGFYKIDLGQLQRFNLFGADTSIRVDSLRVFTWPGFPVLPERDYCDSCGYREVAIGIIDDGDGRFNRIGDAFYFFAQGPSGWADRYDSARPDTVFINHPYENRNYYYLTVSRAENPVPGRFRRIESEMATPGSGAVTTVAFEGRSHHEVDTGAEYFPDLWPRGSTLFWEKWFWRSLSVGGVFSAGFDAPGIDTTQGARLRMRLWGISHSVTSCTGPRPPNHLVDFEVNGTSLGRFGWDGSEGFTIDVPVSRLRTAGNSVHARVTDPGGCTNRTDRVAVAWFDLFYARRLEPVDDVLTFDSPRGSGDYLYRIEPFRRASRPRVFDVTDPVAPRELLGFAYEAVDSFYRLSFQTSQNARRHFRVIQDTSIVSVVSANVTQALATSLVNLRSPAHRADYLVIYYDGFKGAADSLAAWRRAFNRYETETVPISAVYDQFSGGRTDPAAIRNFLRSTLITWERTPGFVTFLGDASYDFKNFRGRAAPGQPGTLLPSFENGFDDVVLRQYASDDWLLNVDNAAVVVPDFFGGRIPVMDVTTALDVVRNKVLRYERAAPFGEYRNRVMLIADDQEQGAVDDRLRWTHLRQTSELDTLATPQHIDRAYVYLHTYPDGPGDTKPTANADIKRNINQTGVALFNYIGHGSPFQVSDERVFLDTDVGTLTNADRLPLFVAASCDIGKFNDPTVQSLGERLIVRPGGGAIGVISATELAFSGQNAALNRVVYQQIFKRDASGRYHVPVAEALLTGKSGATNSQKYQLMGDAALRLNLPRLWVELTLFDSAGVETLATVRKGATVTFRGRLLDGLGGAPVALDGVAALLIEDSAPLDQAPDCPLSPGCGAFCPPPLPPSCGQPFYRFRAGPMYRGDVGVAAGSFEGRFVVPLEAREGTRGRVRAYLSGQRVGGVESDGVGSLPVGIVPGSAPTTDQEGPRIVLTFAGGATAVRPDASLRVELFDPSGILITGHTPQNGIVVTVDDNSTTRVDITPSFRYAADSYQSGTATFRLPNLPEGPHRIRVSAADNLAVGLGAAAHRSSATIDFVVTDQPPLGIRSAYLFPNPTRSRGAGAGGQFVIEAPGDSVNALLRIYTVSGKLIRVIKVLGGLGQIQLPWDGRDERGQTLGNGVYLFIVHVNVREVDGTSSPRQKAVARGRFVIVNS